MLRVFTASTDIADISSEISLSEYRENKINSLKPIDAKKQSRAGGVLLSYALRECFGIDESTVEYAHGDTGKPYFPQYPDVYFNISHTDGAVAAALSDKPVGIDIERVRDFFDGHTRVAVAKRYFSETERIEYGLTRSGVGRPGTWRFYRLWTAKESAVKCTGRGFAGGYREFKIPFFEEKTTVGEYNFTAFPLTEHIVTVCAISPEEVRIENITADMLLK